METLDVISASAIRSLVTISSPLPSTSSHYSFMETSEELSSHSRAAVDSLNRQQRIYHQDSFVCRYLFLESASSLLKINVSEAFHRALDCSRYRNIYKDLIVGEGLASRYASYNDIFAQAIRRLDLSFTPKHFRFREAESEAVQKFIRSGVLANGGRKSLYVSGLPGTGKTATTVAAVQKLQSDPTCPSFRFTVINCLKLHSPADAYTVLWKSISGHHASAITAKKKLTSHFEALKSSISSSDAPTLVCLVDEIDFLMTSNQSVIYNILDWPTTPMSRLVIIGLANTMDLPERFSSRNSSRIGVSGDLRIIFKPYKPEEVEQILEDRVKELGVVEFKALKLISRKAAAMACDLRAALRLCQRVIEKHRSLLTAEELASPKVKLVQVGVVNQVSNEYKETPLMVMTRTSCQLYRAIFVSIVRFNRANGGALEIGSDELFRRLQDTIADLKGHSDFLLTLPPYAIYLDVLDRMVDEGLLMLKGTDKVRPSPYAVRIVKTKLDASDIQLALKGQCFEKLLS